ncbi:MAG: SDR family oxidoreductase [Deltaproteobacteria bacterium]|nr:SDR family oxidoreductase [Deltaproteobacteria bacterium]
MELKDRIAVVTGAGRGIGRAIAMLLAREGAAVVVNSLTKASAEKTAEEIKGMGFSAHSFPADVTLRQNAFALVDWAAATLGGIDILVSNVGFASHMLVEDMPPEVWDRFINVNLTTHFNLAKAALPHMIEKKYGKIVFMGSIAARRISGLGSADYTAGKHGTTGLMKHLAYEVARYNINVNMVNPGTTVTDMTLATSTEEERETLAREYPLGRLSLPEDIAEAVLFLVSEKSRQITGHSIDVESGALIMFSTGYSKGIRRRDETSKRRLAEWEAARHKP